MPFSRWPHLGGLTVLVIDNHYDTVEMLVEYLRSVGAIVLGVSFSGLPNAAYQARRALRRHRLDALVRQAPSRTSASPIFLRSADIRRLCDLRRMLLGVFAHPPSEKLDRHDAERRMPTLARPVGVG